MFAIDFFDRSDPRKSPRINESDRLEPSPKPMKVTDRGLPLSSLGQSYSSQAEIRTIAVTLLLIIILGIIMTIIIQINVESK